MSTSSGSYLICGRHCVEEALRHSAGRIQRLMSSAKKLDKSLVSLARSVGKDFETVDRGELSNLLSTKSHQDLAAEMAAQAPCEVEDLAALDAGIVVLLDSVQDPQNLGAIYRACECFGVAAIGWQSERSAGLTPVVAKQSAGACELVPKLAVSNLARTIDELKAAGFWIIGAEPEGEEEPPSEDFLVSGKRALVMGAEGQGLRKLIRSKLDFSWRLKLFGQIQSLNVSQATSVCLYAMSSKS